MTVIVVNFNGERFLRSCLMSISTSSYPAREILVVDNASTDSSREVIAACADARKGFTVIHNSTNLGFAGAANQAAAMARGKYLAVLNMDLEVDRGWLEPLVEFLESRPSAACVNPLLTLKEGTRINTAGVDVHVSGLGFTRMLGRPVEEAGDSPIPVPGISGAAFLIRRDLYLQVGGMDSSGFLYHEDVDLSWMLRSCGVELSCVPASRVRHDFSLTMYPVKVRLLEQNRWAMLLTHLRVSSLILLCPFLFLTELLAWGYCLSRGWPFVRAKAGSWAAVVRRFPAILGRRRRVRALRTVSDWKVLRHFRFSYPWGQFFSLLRKDGPSGRQRIQGLPADPDQRHTRRS